MELSEAKTLWQSYRLESYINDAVDDLNFIRSKQFPHEDAFKLLDEDVKGCVIDACQRIPVNFKHFCEGKSRLEEFLKTQEPGL